MIKGVRTTAAIAFAIALAAGLCKTSAMAVTFYPEDTAYRNAPPQTTPIDAFGYVGGILEARFYEPHTTTNDPREEISEAASLYGIDLPMMLSIAKVESDFNPHVRTGSYKGLFQLSDYEFRKYGDGSIWDARDNARAAAHMFLVQAERFKWALGHFPDYAERYIVHQQGIEGAIEHYEHPERVAWQSMCATSEGLLKRLFYRSTHHLAKMIADPGFIDLDHLTHRILVTHRLLLHYMKKPSVPKVRKILDVIELSTASPGG